MKTDFKFSNLLGTVYSKGNLLFSPDGTHLYSPVGNRVTVFNLVEYADFFPSQSIMRAHVLLLFVLTNSPATNPTLSPSPTGKTSPGSV